MIMAYFMASVVQDYPDLYPIFTGQYLGEGYVSQPIQNIEPIRYGEIYDPEEYELDEPEEPEEEPVRKVQQYRVKK